MPEYFCRILTVFVLFYAGLVIAKPMDPALMQQLMPGSLESAPLIPIEILTQGPAPEAIALIEKVGGQAVTFEFMNLILANVPASQTFLTELTKQSAVAEIASVQGGREELDISTAAILLKPSVFYPNVNAWWQNGYSGAGGIVGLLDSGVAIEHPGLIEKTTTVRKEFDSTYDDYVNGVRTPHGTGVACIIAGQSETGQGIAYGAENYLIAMAGDVTSEGNDFHAKLLSLESLDWMLIRSGQLPTVINYSFGHGSAGDEDAMDWSATAKVVDYVVNHYDILWVKSAGNGGWIKPQYPWPHHYYLNTLTVPGENYNALTVGNVNTLVYAGEKKYKVADRSKHSIRYTSGRGPTRIGRKKPDLVAPGHDTRTCAPDEDVYDVEENPYFGEYSASEAYDPTTLTRLMGGTSAAAPHVAGAVLLLQEAGITEPKSVKALLINSADAWTDNNQPSPDDPNNPCYSPEPLCGHKQVVGSHWDRTYGWGYVNMQAAFEQRHNLVTGALNTRKRVFYYSTVLDKNEKVTLVTERRVGYHPDNTEWQLTPVYLEILDPETGTLLNADYSRMDNVHQIDNPYHKRKVTIRVSLPWDIRKIDGADEEVFALVSAQPILTE